MKIFLSILVVRTAAIVVSNAKTLRNPWLNDACFFFIFFFFIWEQHITGDDTDQHGSSV